MLPQRRALTPEAFFGHPFAQEAPWLAGPFSLAGPLPERRAGHGHRALAGRNCVYPCHSRWNTAERRADRWEIDVRPSMASEAERELARQLITLASTPLDWLTVPLA
jgi:hypothetical protein